MKIHESGENYLETILLLEVQKGSVRSIDIANELEYSRSSISRAMTILKKNNYINMDESGFITLTETGRNIAKNLYERHKALTNFLVAIGVDGETAHNDACRIEHIISQKSFDMIKRHMEDMSINKQGENSNF